MNFIKNIILKDIQTSQNSATPALQIVFGNFTPDFLLQKCFFFVFFFPMFSFLFLKLGGSNSDPLHKVLSHDLAVIECG